MWKLKTGGEGKELRIVFVETLQEIMKDNPMILALEADLGGASGFTKIKKTNPEQFIQMGISEANMIGTAAGLSMKGYIPYVHTFAPFTTRRALDQIYLEGAYAHNTINIYGSDPGVCVGANGGTHNSFEDIAIMRSIPQVTVLAPADETQMAWSIREVARREGVHYIRGNRKKNLNIYAPGSEFELGRGNVVREGHDVIIFSYGELLGVAYRAAQNLERDGISAEVVDMFTLKPFDSELVKCELCGKQLAVTFENHSIIGGLGSAVAEVMAETASGIPLKRIGANDRFGQVGTYDYLCKEFGLTEEHLEETIKSYMFERTSEVECHII
ncbi:MAG: transketolase C-terminal domain-containing protein [Hungatella hathewayi]|uniref:transketolase family protein n=1 Tax=Hungatella TaxID=1649459 RepID=UPI0011DE1F17|nr:transketolase C-terminal domain-containing protein [Hungatella hathewayi]MDU4971227.1 transketolase C-terminal domain-containing protein [Hungatella hathewayi]